jgi:6,7-dimethyl-8-ribityllumazine synthase
MSGKHLAPLKQPLHAPHLRVLIVHARWNAHIVDALVHAAKRALIEKHHLHPTHIDVKTVPGCFELPLACKKLAKSGNYQAVIAIGVLIKGDTMHFEYIAQAATQGLMNVGLEMNVPVVFGILTCLNEKQALQRAGMEGGHNHGEDWGSAAVEMALLK